MSNSPDRGVRPHGEPAPREDLAFTDRWRRSLERSRARRVAVAVKRRRRLRSRGTALSLVAVLAVSAMGAGVASGQYAQVPAPTLLTKGSQGAEVSAVQQALGLPADGYYDDGTFRAVKRFQAENALLVDGIVGPQTRAALGLASQSAPAQPEQQSGSSSSGAASSGGGATLEQIAQCESGGNPSAVSPGGQYRGKYQFTRETWQALGGSGDPAAAPEGEQDRLAAKLLAQSGTSPWPSCG